MMSCVSALLGKPKNRLFFGPARQQTSLTDLKVGTLQTGITLVTEIGANSLHPPHSPLHCTPARSPFLLNPHTVNAR